MLSHRNIATNGLHMVQPLRFRREMRWLHAAPMFHIADALAIFLTTAVAGRHVFISGFEPVVVMRAMQDEKITDTLLVPTMINMLMNHPDVGNYDLSSLTHMTYGASPMPEAVIRRAMEVLPGCEFTHAYGQTECSPLVSLNGPDAHRGEGLEKKLFRSCGQAVLGVEVKIVDANGATLPPGEVGELCARGGNVMLGYWNKPEQTAAALRDGWMYSGDGAYMDEQWLHLHRRPGEGHDHFRRRERLFGRGRECRCNSRRGGRMRGHRRARRKMGRAGARYCPPEEWRGGIRSGRHRALP